MRRTKELSETASKLKELQQEHNTVTFVFKGPSHIKFCTKA